ncbi:hypothetical protein HK405_012506, partial [Cladochytrium tenue]
SADDVIHVRNALAKIERTFSSSSSSSSSSAGRQRSRLLDTAWTYGARDSTLKDSGFFVSARSVAAAAAAARDAEVDIYGHLAFAAVAGEAVLVMGMDKWAFLHARNIAAVRTEREIKTACTFVVVSDSGVEHRFACATSPEYQAWIDALRTALAPRASASPPAIVIERPRSSVTLRTPPDSDSESHNLRRPRSSLLSSRIAGLSDAARAAAVVLPPRRPSASTLRSIDSAVSSSSRRRFKQAPEFAERAVELDDDDGDTVRGGSLPRRTDSTPVATDSSAAPSRGRARAKPARRSAAAARRATSAGSVAASHPAASGTSSPRTNSRHRPVVVDADEDWRDPAGPSLRLREAGASGSLDRRIRSASRPRSHVDLRATPSQMPHHESAHHHYNYQPPATSPVALRRTLSTPRSAMHNAVPPPQEQPPDHPGFPSRPGSQVRFAAYDELVAHRPVPRESYSPPVSSPILHSGSSGAAAAAAAAVAAAAEAGMLPPPSVDERRAWRRRYYEDAFAEPAKVHLPPHAATTTTSTATIPATAAAAAAIQAPESRAAAAATRSSSPFRSASPSRVRAPRAASPSRRRPAADPDAVADSGPLLPLPDRKKFSLAAMFGSRNRRDDDPPPSKQQPLPTAHTASELRPPQLPPLAFAPADDDDVDDDDDNEDGNKDDNYSARGIDGGGVDDVDGENDNDDIRPRRARARVRAASPFRPAAAVVAAARAVAARSRS